MVAGFAWFKLRARGKLTRLIGLIFCIGSLSSLISYLFASMKWTSLINLPGSIYDLIVIPILSVVYATQNSSKHKFIYVSIALLFLAAGLINLIFIQKESYASYTKLLSSIIVMSYAIIYFFQLIFRIPTAELRKLPMFWFNSAFLVYHAGTIFLFALTPYLINVLKDNMIVYMSFHNILSIVQHLIILTGLYIDLKIINPSPKFH